MATITDGKWLARFHAGEHTVIAECYREHAAAVIGATASILSSVDAETVTHELFSRLLSRSDVRLSFRGGNLRGWLVQVATNAARDLLRRRQRELSLSNQAEAVDPARLDEELEAKLLVERFRQTVLPAALHGLFETRFLKQLSQREAALQLGVARSTLLYQEQQVRALLQRFLLEEEDS